MQEKEFILRSMGNKCTHVLADRWDREREKSEGQTERETDRKKEIHVEYKEIKKQRIPVVLVLLLH